MHFGVWPTLFFFIFISGSIQYCPFLKHPLGSCRIFNHFVIYSVAHLHHHLQFITMRNFWNWISLTTQKKVNKIQLETDVSELISLSFEGSPHPASPDLLGSTGRYKLRGNDKSLRWDKNWINYSALSSSSPGTTSPLIRHGTCPKSCPFGNRIVHSQCSIVNLIQCRAIQVTRRTSFSILLTKVRHVYLDGFPLKQLTGKRKKGWLSSSPSKSHLRWRTVHFRTEIWIYSGHREDELLIETRTWATMNGDKL